MEKIMIKVFDTYDDIEKWDAGITYYFENDDFGLAKAMEVIKFNLEQNKFIEIYKRDN